MKIQNGDQLDRSARSKMSFVVHIYKDRIIQLYKHPPLLYIHVHRIYGEW